MCRWTRGWGASRVLCHPVESVIKCRCQTHFHLSVFLYRKILQTNTRSYLGYILYLPFVSNVLRNFGDFEIRIGLHEIRTDFVGKDHVCRKCSFRGLKRLCGVRITNKSSRAGMPCIATTTPSWPPAPTSNEPNKIPRIHRASCLFLRRP